MPALTPSHRFPDARRLMAVSAWVWLVASALTAVVGWGLGQPTACGLVLLVGLMSLAVALLSAVPLRLVRTGGPALIPMAVLASTATRLCLTVVLAVGLCEMQMAPRQTIGLWAILWYALLMTAELSSVIRYAAGDRRPNDLPAGEPKVQ